MKSLLLLTLVAASCISLIRCNVMEQLRADPDLSQFYTLLERDPIAHATVSLRAVTVFVPTNEAFQRKTTNETYVLYHISTVALTRDQLPKSVPSDLDGNPPLYITRNRNGDLYVNNARIVPSRTMQTVVDEKHPDKKQMIHVIEDVLEPLTLLPTSLTSIEISNPDAYQFLNHADSMKIGHFRLRSYRSQVTLMKKESLYQSPGGHTFLIPIDEGFKIAARSNLVDSKVIDGHVLPNNVIFTAAAHLEVPQTTAAFEDNMKVTVSFFQQKDGKMYVKSNTMVTPDSKYPEGVVLAEIVQGNIPVRNGVVHLIHRPLMIVDTTVTQYIENTDNGTLYKFYEVIMDLGGQVLDDIKGLGAVTILAPSNEAWNHSNVNNVIRNREKMREILNMHIIKGAVNVTHIRERNKNAFSHVQTVNNKTFLYFNINSDGNGNETITVEGGGVNATLIHPNLIQKNGYVHIIDRVLGVPYTTVLGKLSTDPMLNSTFFLGRDSGFNDQLNNSARRYTFFVPRDKAWMKTEVEYPSAHKKLFMRSFAYHARSILERHLVIADRTYTMQDLVAMSSDSIVLPTLRDSLKIRVIEESGGRYSIYWNLKKITVYRPDVECTNGIIHVIDAPFLEEKDIRVNGGILRAQFQISALVSILLAKILLL